MGILGDSPSSGRFSDLFERRSDRLVMAGAVVFALGVLATLVTVTPLLLGASPLPVAAYYLCSLAPIGLGIALGGLWAEARARRRR